MTGSRIYGLRLDDEMRERWDAAADACGMKLAEFIKRCVEDRIAGPEAIRAALAAPPTKSGGLCAPIKDQGPRLVPMTPSGDKRYTGPDPKGGKSK